MNNPSDARANDTNNIVGPAPTESPATNQSGLANTKLGQTPAPALRLVDIKAILADPEKRKDMFVRATIAAQARKGITTTREQAEYAYDKVQEEKRR